MYEDFPYTNLHELNLDWLVDVVQQLKDNAVISVNGQTGEVVLYQNAVVRLPDVPDADWTLLRSTNGVTRGIKFDRSGNAYIVAGNSLASVFTPENPPASSQITYDQYVRLTTLSDAQMHNWNIFRTLNNQSTGIEFDDTGDAYIISGSNRYKLYSTKNPISGDVSSVNGQTGDVVLYTDSNGAITMPAVTNPNIDAWSISRTINGTACTLYIYDDGQVTIVAGSDEYRLVNSEELTEVSDVVDKMESILGGELIVDFTWIPNSYVETNGTIYSYNGWKRTDYEEISENYPLVLYASATATTQVYNCFYDANKQFISNFLVNKSTTVYTVPNNAKYFILSTQQANVIQRGIYDITLTTSRNNLGVDMGRVQAYTYYGSLSASQTIKTNKNFASKEGFKIGFTAEFSGSFNGITFQFDAYSPNQIIIDGTNITTKSRFETDNVTPHGITITDNIQVNVLQDTPTTAKITICSDGVMDTKTCPLSITAYEQFQLINGSTALSNVIFTMGCGTINHRMWAFGDSYFGTNNSARWLYYVFQNGYTKNTMFCGSSGSGSIEAKLWLDSLLSAGMPKTIIWCIGMNDNSDSSSAPSTQWMNMIDYLTDLCDKKGIELILATIPTVPSINHEQKNNYVRSSGYRYIDFAKAVGATAAGQWKTGMLSNDNIHPTALGAIALYNAAISAVPELTFDY